VQVWRLVMDTAGPSAAVGNLNFFRVVAPSGGGGGPTPFTGTPVALPGTIEAENFDEGGEGVAYHDVSSANRGGQYRAEGVDIEATSDAGGGYNVGWISPGEWLLYTVNVTAAGTYTLEFRVACGGQGGTFHLEINGVDVTGPLTIPNTGGWQTWATVTKTGMSLPAGQQRWRLVFDSAGSAGVGNLNFVRVVSP
ncbi:MAG TPA: carbohydrate-binding protein, partial [Vicinamibacterales bacterium]|nr:carbohydrate-binding protein [Vicinamibacterales bacterium]